jgi:hypothetical protein
MAKDVNVVDLTPRWTVLIKKDKEAFVLKFNQVDDMLIAISRARRAGYKIMTIPYKGATK